MSAQGRQTRPLPRAEAAPAPTAGPPSAQVPTAHVEALARGRSFLRSTHLGAGGWPYVPGGTARAEPSVLVAAVGDEDTWIDEGWLSAAELGWAGLLLPALAWQRAPAACHAAMALLDALASVPVEQQHGFDATLPGWSWVPGTAAWVEPTVFAMLSLRRTGLAPARLEQGERLLLDRQCADGGWNYGNPKVYGAQLDGHLDATGWALLALSPSEAADRGFQFLQGCLQRPSTLNLSLAALASAAHDRDPRPFLDRLVPRIGDAGARRRVDLTAMACAALRLSVEQHNAFRQA